MSYTDNGRHSLQEILNRVLLKKEKIIAEGRLVLQKTIKNTENGNYMSKYKALLLFNISKQ